MLDPVKRDAIIVAVVGIAVAVLLVVVLAIISRADAHEDMPWYRTLRTPEGFSCCNERDCRPAPEARARGEHWEVQIGGVWVVVPDDRVLRVENPTGQPHVCHIGPRVICFVPGPVV